jgi:hypothetical protein
VEVCYTYFSKVHDTIRLMRLREDDLLSTKTSAALKTAETSTDIRPRNGQPNEW